MYKCMYSRVSVVFNKQCTLQKVIILVEFAVNVLLVTSVVDVMEQIKSYLDILLQRNALVLIL